MRYRVKKDFVLRGGLLVFGDSLFLQQAQEDTKKWDVYSLYTRQLVGQMNKEEVETYLLVDPNPPKEKFIKHVGNNKSIRDISLSLLLFIMPLGAICQVNWSTKMVQTEENIFELHLSAKIDSGWFLYPLNERKKCELCPVLMLEKSSDWEVIDGPELYSYGSKLPPERCGSLPSPYCPVERFTDSVVYIQVIRSKTRGNAGIKGHIQYYPTHRDSTGQSKDLTFYRSLYSSTTRVVSSGRIYVRNRINYVKTVKKKTTL